MKIKARLTLLDSQQLLFIVLFTLQIMHPSRASAINKSGERDTQTPNQEEEVVGISETEDCEIKPCGGASGAGGPSVSLDEAYCFF